MKTKELKYFYQALSNLNSSFTHYSLVWNQFLIDYSEEFSCEPNKLTKDYFKNNPFKRKHNIKFQDLEIEHNKTDRTLINGIFLLIYTHFEDYLKSLHSFSSRVDSYIKPLETKLEDNENDTKLLDKVLNRIGINKETIDVRLLNTLDYIRLKRNRLIHKSSDNLSSTFLDLIKEEGQTLNSFWNSQLPGKLQQIDFSCQEKANTLTFRIIIDTINILRVIASSIDFMVVNCLTPLEIINSIIVPDFSKIQKKRMKNITFKRLEKKFRRYCEIEYSLRNVDDVMIESLKCSIA